MLKPSFIVLALALFAAVPAMADEGELYIDLALTPELALLSNARAGAALPFDATGSLAFLPRLGFGARWGLTNELHVGAGFDAAYFPNITASNAVLEGYSGSLYANHAAFALPLMVGYRFDSGYDFTGLVEFHAGPALAFWQNTAFADPSKPDGNGLPSAIPVTLGDDVHLGGTVRANVAFEARFFDFLVVAVGPSLAATWAGGLHLEAGLLIRPSIAFGAGPL